jgi:hypothetical protein
MELGELMVAVHCPDCGKTAGKPAGNGKNRCADCGKFAPSAENYCMTHDIDYEGLYPEDNHCPLCREERNIREQRQHEITRDPQVEPW